MSKSKREIIQEQLELYKNLVTYMESLYSYEAFSYADIREIIIKVQKNIQELEQLLKKENL